MWRFSIHRLCDSFRCEDGGWLCSGSDPPLKIVSVVLFVSFHYCVVVVTVLEKKNHCYCQPFQPRQWAFSQKTAMALKSQTGSAVFWWWLCNYVVRAKKKRYFDTFQDVWWVSISVTTHYNCIHMIINSCGYMFRLTGGRRGITLKITHR